jgi:hypothetical protein
MRSVLLDFRAHIATSQRHEEAIPPFIIVVVVVGVVANPSSTFYVGL